MLHCKENNDLLEAPKFLKEYEVSMTRYYRDKDNVYCYLEKSGNKVYDDQIKEQEKNSTDEAGSSDVGGLSADARAYFDELFEKIMADNQFQEDQIMDRIEVVAKEVKEGR